MGKSRTSKFYDARVQRGVCGHCGSRPLDGKTKMCAICRDKNKVRLAANKERRSSLYKTWASKNKERLRARDDRYRKKLKREVLIKYGGQCVCCGLNDLRFLTIDHKNGGGNEERRRLGGQAGASKAIYVYARKHFPPHLQVMCWNCNMAKNQYGQCPHAADLNAARTISGRQVSCPERAVVNRPMVASVHSCTSATSPGL
jgi:hypothetical protein